MNNSIIDIYTKENLIKQYSTVISDQWYGEKRHRTNSPFSLLNHNKIITLFGLINGVSASSFFPLFILSTDRVCTKRIKCSFNFRADYFICSQSSHPRIVVIHTSTFTPDEEIINYSSQLDCNVQILSRPWVCSHKIKTAVLTRKYDSYQFIDDVNRNSTEPLQINGSINNER